ncbi:ABC transporter permease [Variovorax saccharolyticus]|uniref:ABC transporter permease n=1 Tax=Variovorax saccharolyticus TaxID=3053516 RepID=UPI0025785465|nr:ABC transporter permease [Variovorax sp. J22R187]MDM0019588.1 ABC transporter permease [Variovorax sp. J22R187]
MTSASNTPHLILKPGLRGVLFPFKEVLEYRDLLHILALRDVKLRYRQTAVGVVWVLLQPLIGAWLFAFVFGRVAKLPTGDDRIPYFIFSYAGLLIWNAFIQILQKSSESLVSNSGLVSKIYFPRVVLPLSTVLGVLIDFAIGAVVLALLMAIYGIAPSVSLLFMPVALLMAILLALGIGLWAAALNVSYRDVRYVVPVFAQFLLWASPVAYASSNIPASAQWFVALNPMVGILESFRWAVLGIPVANWSLVVVSAVASVLLFVIGSAIFQRHERRFADVI